MTTEQTLENKLIDKLKELKYTYRPDIKNREALEKNFREKFESLNKVQFKDSEFARLIDDILTPNVFLASQRLRQMNTFIRDNGTSLDYTLLNIKDWCKNEFEVVHQLKMNTQESNHRYDVILLINGLLLAQIELKTLEISPRRAIQQIVDYKNDLGNGYTNSLLCFMQLFIISNYSNTYYFANNNLAHFQFGADEKFLPIYQFADEKNKKITNLDDFAEHFLSKCKLAEMISQYMVLVQTQEKILIMRPYQIYAVQSILNCVMKTVEMVIFGTQREAEKPSPPLKPPHS